MKLHTIGTFEQDGREIKGVILEGTTEEVRAIAKLYAAGHDDFRVLTNGTPAFTPHPDPRVDAAMCNECGNPHNGGACQASHP